MSENIRKWRQEQVAKLDLLYDEGWLTDAEYNRRIDELYMTEPAQK